MYNNSSIKNIRWSKQSFQCHIVHEVTGRNNMETMVTFEPTSHTNKGKINKEWGTEMFHLS
jgi:hypothetical protein